MADRNFCREVGCLNRGVVRLQGSVVIAADASVTTSSFLGGTFTRTAAGEYTLTLADTYQGLLAVSACIMAAAVSDLVVKVKSQTVATTKLIVFNTVAHAVDPGVITDPAAVMTIYVTLDLDNSTVA